MTRDLPLILVVEDSVQLNRLIERSLEETARVASARDGQDGLEKALALLPDLIITDIRMPRMSGHEMTLEIRKRPELESVPILVLSALAEDDVRVRLLREGAQDYVNKPFSVDELQARAANLIQISRARGVLQAALATSERDLESLALELTRRNRDLDQALESTRVARDAAERASRAKSDFMSLLSHELRTPLTTMRLQLDLLGAEQMAPTTPAQRASLAKLGAAQRRLHDAVDGLLEYARLHAGQLSVEPAVLDVAALVAEVTADARRRADAKGLAVRVDARGAATFHSDPRLLSLVVLELVENAVQHTDRGQVGISVEVSTNTLRLEVVDTGRGIPAHVQTRIFQPFEQLEPARNKHAPGMGLGLAVVKSIVLALSGTITLTSSVGTGSCFSVSIPASPESADGAASAVRL